jgi:hypothetical protein
MQRWIRRNVLGEADDPIARRVVSVVAELVTDEEPDQRGASDAEREPPDVDRREELLREQLPRGRFEVDR